MTKSRATWILLIGVLGTSTSAILARFSGTPAQVIATMRLFFTVLLLTPVVFAKNRRELFQTSKKDILSCAASGAFLAVHFLLYFQAVKMTSVTNATVLVSTNVIFTALGFVFILKGKIPRTGVIAILIAFLGTAVIAFTSGGSGDGNIVGDLLALGGAAFFSGYMLFGRRMRGHMSTNVYTWFTYLSCFVCLLLFDLVTATPLWGWSGRDWLVGLLLCLLCTFGGHSVFNWSYKYLTPDYVANVILLQPIFAGVLAFFLLGEVPQLLQWVGVALIIGGVLLYSKVQHEPQEEAG